MKSRINRNIVECKSVRTYDCYDFILGINRNIVECKSLIINFFQFLLCELIETLWNVNILGANPEASWVIELIETLWNVNILGANPEASWVIELIETLWNVNAHR